MRELLRTQSSEHQEEQGLILGLATTSEELEALQRLRFDVYTKEMNAIFPEAINGIDKDRFDDFCEHLIVCDARTQKIVGTYRMMSPEQAQKAGGYYSESEFDLSQLASIRHTLSECGRSCTHADYRSGSAIMLLWTGLSRYMHQNNYRYMLGCASVSLADGGVQAAEVWRASQLAMQEYPDRPRVTPLQAYPTERFAQFLGQSEKIKIPPLIKGYLKLGAYICGEPAWDKNFNAADFPVMIDLTGMDIRYRKHFGIES